MPVMQIDYEKKIEASRDQSFIENLLDNNSQRTSQVGNRFMSPALRLLSTQNLEQELKYGPENHQKHVPQTPQVN